MCVCLLLDKTNHFFETWPGCNFAKATKCASPMCSRAGFFSVAAAATAASGTTAAAASTAGGATAGISQMVAFVVVRLRW